MAMSASYFKLVLISLLFYMSLILTSPVFAIDGQSSFDFPIEQANEQFDKISIKLSTQNIKAEALKSAISDLSELDEQAKKCITKTELALTKLNKQLETLNIDTKKLDPQSNLNYLLEKKNHLTQRNSSCRLFSIRAEEAINAYTHTLHQIRTSALFDKKNPVWDYIVKPNNFNVNTEQISFNNLWDQFILEHWEILLFLLLFYAIYFFIIRYGLYGSLKTIELPKHEGARSIKRLAYKRFNTLGIIIFVFIYIYLGLSYSQFPPEILHLSQIIGMILISATLIWIAFLLPGMIKYKPISFLLVASISIFLITILGVASYGYYALIRYILFNIFLSITGLLIIIFFGKVHATIIQSLQDRKYYWQKRLRYYLDIRERRGMPEVTILNLVISFTVWIAYLVYLVYVWGWKTVYPDKLITALTDGFSIFNITIDPLQIFIAIITFIVLSLAGRFLSGHIARKSRQQEKDLQVAFASIIGYIGFGVAIFIALLVSGVNFTGLAIIAGALSVGIGLGLQDIVNNFVSGIILLLEKPIRPGDRIIVGNTEGFVKRVRVRATQITTQSRSDVIVPNADLIKTQVTNYMFRDPLWRVECKVGVAYGSDTALVRKLLHEVAQNHENVIQEEPNQPRVLFKAFGESSLDFELWCIIKNVNNKYVVQSELNFEIDRVFREHGITIAFPQRDVHLYHTDGKDS